MAKTVSEEEIQLRKRARRRLVGAITLVVVAIVILPMILDSRPEQRSHEIDIRIPSEDSVDEFPPQAPATEAQVTPTPGKPATEIQQEDRIAPQSAVKSVQPTKESVEQRDAVSETKRRSIDHKAESETDKTAVPAADMDLFVVQLGAFSDQGKAKQQLRSLMSKDTKAQVSGQAYTETLKSDKGDITRVRVGPFRTREEAEGTREKLKKLGFEGVVTEKGL
jgi:DedD protein